MLLSKHVIVMLLACMIKAISVDSPPESDLDKKILVEQAEIPDADYVAQRGDEAKLAGYNKKDQIWYSVDGATDSYYYKKYWEALDIKDFDETQEMRARENTVEVLKFTKVLVIEKNVFESNDVRPNCYVVRVLEGEHKGKKLWVPTWEVVRTIPNPKYSKPSAMAKNEPKPQEEISPKARLAAGIKLEKSGKIVDAIVEYRLIIRDHIDSPEAEIASKKIEAIEDAREAKRIAEKVSASLKAAKNLEKDGKYPGALDYYREIVKLAPKSPEATIARGRIKKLTAK